MSHFCRHLVLPTALFFSWLACHTDAAIVDLKHPLMPPVSGAVENTALHQTRRFAGGSMLPKISSRKSGRRLMVRGKAGAFEIILKTSVPEHVLSTLLSAVQVWSDPFPCKVPIRVALSWRPLPGLTLGQTVQLKRVTKTSDDDEKLRHLRMDTVYPAVVASALTGHDFVENEEAHIAMTFNSRVSWHFDISTDAPQDKYDLATAVLHGVGFLGEIARIGKADAATFANEWRLPGRFDRFLEDGSGAGVASKCKITKGQLFESVTSSQLRFAGFGLNSPETYRGGSQTYHLSEETLKQDCQRLNIPEADCSDLMTPKVSTGYTQRSLGVPTITILNHILSAERGYYEPGCGH